MINISMEAAATACFACAVIHTFATKFFATLSQRFRDGSLGENLFHYLAEVEVVFGIWAMVFLSFISYTQSVDHAVQYLESVNYTEALFVFVIMAMASTRPVLYLCESLVGALSGLAPARARMLAYFVLCLSVLPLLGSFVTEPAAMVVAALLLEKQIFTRERSALLRYSTLAVLMVNISIGGTLTHFAAPPVIMVAKAWGWDLPFMLANFGWKSAVVVVINAAALTGVNYKELSRLKLDAGSGKSKVPLWMALSHCLFMFLVVKYHHSPAFFIPLFLLFIGWADVTREYQTPLKLRESLLVGFFLGGLVTLGQLQRWWIEPLIGGMDPLPLFLGATALTAVTDNAALTYLGTLVTGLSDVSKYVLVAGAVAGGGLTVIANAPNPIAVGLLKSGFSGDSINPGKLFLAALLPTIASCLGFWYL